MAKPRWPYLLVYFKSSVEKILAPCGNIGLKIINILKILAPCGNIGLKIISDLYKYYEYCINFCYGYQL